MLRGKLGDSNKEYKIGLHQDVTDFLISGLLFTCIIFNSNIGLSCITLERKKWEGMLPYAAKSLVIEDDAAQYFAMSILSVILNPF